MLSFGFLEVILGTEDFMDSDKTRIAHSFRFSVIRLGHIADDCFVDCRLLESVVLNFGLFEREPRLLGH